MSTNEMLMQRVETMSHQIERLTAAVQLFAQNSGKRLNKSELGEHLHLHRNTVRRVVAKPGFPKPDMHGRWLLEDVIAWEVADRKH